MTATTALALTARMLAKVEEWQAAYLEAAQAADARGQSPDFDLDQYTRLTPVREWLEGRMSR